MTESVYSLYLLHCDNDILYTGIAINPEERLKQHQSKKPPGAKFTRRFKQLELVYQVIVGNRSQAQRVEHHLRKRTKQEKIDIINAQLDLQQLRSYLSIDNE